MKTEVLRMENISKVQSGVKILDGFRLNVYRGEVLGIVGLSGTGKTAIANILAGLEAIDAGRIYFEERPVSNLNKGAWKRLGIFTIHHTARLVPQLSIADNIFIIKDNSYKKVIINQKAINQQAKMLLEEVGLEIPPQTIAQELTPAQQHLVELAKAIAASAKLVVLDDIAEFYTMREINKLKEIINKLKDKEISFIYESHKPDELSGFADRVTILREGKNAKTLNSEEYERNMILNLLVGSEYKEMFQRDNTVSLEVVLELCGVCTSRIDNISLGLRKGEILGILDLENKATAEVYNLLSGAVQPVSGKIQINGAAIKINNINHAIRNGIGLIPEDALNTTLFHNMDFAENLSFLILKKMSGYVMNLNKRVVDYIAKEFGELLEIDETDRNTRIQSFDACTRQKMLLYRWLIYNPKVLVCGNLGAMLDIVTKEISYSFINEAAKNGIGVLLVTSDLSEAASICDRIILVSESRVRGEYTRESIRSLSANDLY